MLKLATVTRANQAPVDVWVNFNEPDEVRLGGRVLSDECSIEYETAALPDLAEADIAVIDGISHNVREPPRRLRDGFYSLAFLKPA